MNQTESVEIWKDVVGYEDRYQVSDQGAVRVKYGNLLKPQPKKDGYYTVTLAKNKQPHTHFIHRLVLSAFVGEPLPGQICRHRDGNNGNNQVTNLYWDREAIFWSSLPGKAFVDFRKCDQDGCEKAAEILIRVGLKRPRSYLCCAKHARKIERLHGGARATVQELTPEEVRTNHSVYRILCLSNNQVYVGRTKDLNERRSQHFQSLINGKHTCREMQADYDLFGFSAFIFEILEQHISPGDITDHELWWIKHFDSCRNGYNAHMYDFWDGGCGE